MVKPLSGKLLIEPLTTVEASGFMERLKTAGLEWQPPKMSGVPNVAIVYAVADDITDIPVGMKIVFDEPNPHGFKWEGHKLLAIKKDQVLAGIVDEL